MQIEALERDYERLRGQQVDDAMLIERMRNYEKEMGEFINVIVGIISNFSI